MNLKALDLEKKWPKLARLQDEVRDLERHRLEAESKVAQIRAGIPGAREQDLNAAAKAIRSGAKSPTTSNEEEAKGRLAVAERNRDVMARAVEAAQSDVSQLPPKAPSRTLPGRRRTASGDSR